MVVFGFAKDLASKESVVNGCIYFNLPDRQIPTHRMDQMLSV